VAVVQHKVLQELERLNETDVEVDEEQLEQLERNQRMALEYRERCRRVLEGTLEAINGDEYFDE
jgi:histone-lysine N-methyltransferase SETD3